MPETFLDVAPPPMPSDNILRRAAFTSSHMLYAAPAAFFYITTNKKQTMAINMNFLPLLQGPPTKMSAIYTHKPMYTLVFSGATEEVYKVMMPVVLRNLTGEITAFCEEGETVRVKSGSAPAINSSGYPVYRLVGEQALIAKCANSAGPKPRGFTANYGAEVYARLSGRATDCHTSLTIQADNAADAAQMAQRADAFKGKRLDLGGGNYCTITARR
jgi:hypothetical protein